MEETLLQDLVQYRKSKDKGVVMAARGLLGLYRNVGAEMLHRRDRGKEAALNMRDGKSGATRFGEVKLGQIEGIELLEAWKEVERKRKREEKGLASDDEDVEEEEDEEAGWKNWDVEEDESDDSGGWIDVSSEGEDIDISDSEDDKPPVKKTKLDRINEEDAGAENKDPQAVEEAIEAKLSRLATTKILTPADFAKLQELRTSANITSVLPSAKKTQRQKPQPSPETRHNEDPLTAAEIEGLASLSHKATKAEKIAAAKGDRGEKHQSTTAIRKEKKRAEGKSTTNKEKQRQKNFLMTLGKAKRKGKRSLGDVRKALKGHVERGKKGGRRGNR